MTKVELLISIVLDTFCICKSLALQLKNTRSDEGGIIDFFSSRYILYLYILGFTTTKHSKWRRWNCFFLLFSIHFVIVNLGLYNYKILEVTEVELLISLVLDTFCICKSLALQIQNTRSDEGGIAFFYCSRYILYL